MNFLFPFTPIILGVLLMKTGKNEITNFGLTEISLLCNMYQVTYTLPESKHTKTKLLKMDEQQTELYQIIDKNL